MRVTEQAEARATGRCFYCGQVPETIPGVGVIGPLVRDHFIPRSLGGADGTRNRVDACRRCDRRKGNLHPRDFLRSCPVAGQERIRAKLAELGQPLKGPRQSRPGKVKERPGRDGRSTSDGPGSWYGRPPSAKEVRAEQERIERWMARPMPPPSWSAAAQPRSDASHLPPLPLRSLRGVRLPK